MDVKSIILGFLMTHSMTGYELRQFFSISFSFISGLSYGSIYPALRKMEKEGLITMRMEIQDGAPNRKVYTITEAGKEAFMEALRAPLPFERHKNSFLTRLFFFAHLPPEERKTLVAKHLALIREIRDNLEAARPRIEVRADRFQFLCFQFGTRFFRDLTENINEILTALEDEREGSS